MTDVLTHTALTHDEFLAGLDADQLHQLVGLVEYDESHDPFPVTGWDAVVWVVGNATQTRPASTSPRSGWSWSGTPARRPASRTTRRTC